MGNIRNEIHRKDKVQQEVDKLAATLGDRFDGVLVLAHERSGKGRVERYVAIHGDILALVMHAKLWSQASEDVMLNVDVKNSMTSILLDAQKRSEDLRNEDMQDGLIP